MKLTPEIIEQELGIVTGRSKIKPIKPNPKSLKPTLEILRLLNKKFGQKQTKQIESTIFFAFFPWNKNTKKVWFIVCKSLPAVYSNEAKIVSKVIKKKHPDYEFEIISFWGKKLFDIKNGCGTTIGK